MKKPYLIGIIGLIFVAGAFLFISRQTGVVGSWEVVDGNPCTILFTKEKVAIFKRPMRMSTSIVYYNEYSLDYNVMEEEILFSARVSHPDFRYSSVHPGDVGKIDGDIITIYEGDDRSKIRCTLHRLR